MNTGIMSSPKCKVTIGAIFITMFIFAFVYAQPAAACWQTPQPGTYQNISVQAAHRMIERDHDDRILILDVRYQCEYSMGHLYGAVLIPYDQLQARISELEAYKNSEIIVYCKSGYRSQIACEILANHSFTRVYNMVGGILAWISAGYSIYTTYHYATVNVADGEVLTHIEPLLIYQTVSTPCTQNQTQPSCNQPTNTTNIQSTVLEQSGNRTVTLLTYEVNGTAFEMTIARTLLWSYEEHTSEIDKSARFISMEIMSGEVSAQFYALSYRVQCSEYNLTIDTVLKPLNSEAYNSSYTIVNYVPAEKPVKS
nr:rhodanese-like domain-containing protein [Candidatus Njordarchaeota archaeon]